jgi:hypothetical protein
MFYSNRHNEQFRAINVKTHSVFDFVNVIRATDGKKLGYEVKENLAYWSVRYRKWITIKKGDKSDGATSAPDIDSWCWLIHDDLCNFGVFEDGSKCTNWQASKILSDILREEGKWFRSFTWFVGTWLIGGGKARENGMF